MNLILWAILSLVILVILVVVFLPAKKTERAVSPLLKLDGLIKGFKPTITLTSGHFGLTLTIPRIDSLDVKKRKAGKRALTIRLPALESSDNIITFKEPTDNVNKSNIIKVESPSPVLLNGKMTNTFYMWHQVGGGDVVLRHAKNQYGYKYWVAEGGSNLRDSPEIPETAGNVVSTIKNCLGAVENFGKGANTTYANVGVGLGDAADCYSGIINCMLGLGACNKGQPQPPLTNADIQNDMKIVLQQQLIDATGATITTDWNKYRTGGTISSQAYLNLLAAPAGQPPNIPYNLISEYGLPGGDPEVILSLSNFDSNHFRGILVNQSNLSSPIGNASCPPGESSILCQQVQTFEAILSIVQTGNNFPGNFTPINTAQFWPFYTQLVSSYMITIREIAQKSPRVDGEGNYLSPWYNLTNEGENVYQTLMADLLPLAYQFYNIYVENFQQKIVWEAVEWTINPNGIQLPTFNSNYCAWNGKVSDEDGNGQPIAWSPKDGLSFSGITIYYPSNQGQSNNYPFYSLVNNNFLNSNSSFSLLIPEWNQNNLSASLFTAQPNYTQDGFPGFGVNAANSSGVERFIAPYSGAPLAYFCQTNTANTDSILSAMRLSATEWLHDHNGYPFDVYDRWASEAGLTCTSVSGSLNPVKYACTAIGSTYTENAYIFSSAVSAFGSNNGSISSISQRGTLLMESGPKSVTIDYQATQTFDEEIFPSFSNGFPFDASIFSSSGWIDIPVDGQLCCPSSTVAIRGASLLSVSESPGSEEDPEKMRALFCVEALPVDNTSTVMGLSVQASPCEPYQFVFQTATPTVIKTDYYLNGAPTGFLRAQDLIPDQTLFVEMGLPLQMNTNLVDRFLVVNNVFFNTYSSLPPNVPYVQLGATMLFENTALAQFATNFVADGEYIRIDYKVGGPSDPVYGNYFFTYTTNSANFSTPNYTYVVNTSFSNGPGMWVTVPKLSVYPSPDRISNLTDDPRTNPNGTTTPYFYSPGITYPFGVSYSTQTADAIPRPLGGICAANTQYVTDFYSNTSIDVPQMLVYNYSFTSNADSLVPLVITVSDKTTSVLVTNTGLQNNYNYQFGDIHTSTMYEGTLTFGLQSGQCAANCETGTSFEFLEMIPSDNNLATELVEGNTYLIRVFEFVEPYKEAPANVGTCQNEPYALCNECPFPSTHSALNWSGYLKGQTETAPAWTVRFVDSYTPGP